MNSNMETLYVTSTYSIVEVKQIIKVFILMVFAKKDYVGHIFNVTGPNHVWRCLHLYDSPLRGNKVVCDYFSGEQELPAIPGQCCYQCGGERSKLLAVLKATGYGRYQLWK